MTDTDRMIEGEVEQFQQYTGLSAADARAILTGVVPALFDGDEEEWYL